MGCGSQIRKKRIGLKWSQTHLAKKVGIEQKEVSRIETGRMKRFPEESLLHKFAKVLKVPLSYLYEGEMAGTHIPYKYKILVALTEVHENTLAKFYHRGKGVILKPEKGKAEIKGKVIECTKSFGEEGE